MSISISRSFVPFSEIKYNQEVQELFDAFNGLEKQTKTLAALTITPLVDSTGVFKVTQNDGDVVFAVDTTNHAVGIGCNPADYLG